MLRQVNLAPIRFRQACAADGPIRRTEWVTISLFGQSVCQANAWLQPGLRPCRRAGIYSDADGTGTASTATVARHKAISEALERWAYDTSWPSRDPALGFDLDPTSSGMAAFPGLVADAARPAALAEAVERFCLVAWSEGLLDSTRRSTEWEGIEAVEINSPVGATCVILFRRNAAGFYAYGHAAAESFTGACERALIELDRNERVVGRAWLAPETQSADTRQRRCANLFERRCLFFATEVGHAAFLRRVGSARRRLAAKPRLVVDRAIHGPWSTYASVWRCLFQPAVTDFLRNDEDFFLW